MKITLILLILIIILFLISLSKRDYMVNYPDIIETDYMDKNLYTNLDHYRIGDIISGYTSKKNYNSSLDLDKDTLLKFPNSIASEYIRSIDSSLLKKESTPTTNKELYLYKVNFLKDLLKKINISKSNDVIIHLRIGDILDNPDTCKTNKTDLDNYLNNNIKKGFLYESYIKPLSYYENILHELKKENIKEIIIIAGSHIKCNNFKYSNYFINKVKKLFELNGINVILILASHPDEDIKRVINCKKFYKSSGGYSELLYYLNNST